MFTWVVNPCSSLMNFSFFRYENRLYHYLY
nr:MAG TPA: glycoprotein [Caudoviricetes sp.]